jgi:nitrile hydratase
MHGLGAVEREPDEPTFHAAWERRAFALTLAMGFHGRWNIDAARHAREDRHPVDYLSSSYYEIWFKALERLVVETGLVTPEELASGRAAPATGATPVGHDPATVAAMLKRGFTARLPDDEGAPPRFAVGDAVLVREITTPAHTRVPRYCRGRRGVVAIDHGTFVFPDTHARGLGKKPQRVYSVRFDGRTLWGEGGDPTLTVHVDLWDDYLEPAP